MGIRVEVVSELTSLQRHILRHLQQVCLLIRGISFWIILSLHLLAYLFIYMEKILAAEIYLRCR